ncbi:MAG: sensor histidine kinase [Desulfobacterales bacterium]|jgi:C4-dicarboxylate-specific signal transduction histidine kinase|nr:sensor histidine kinase [Desulfobacterales bacterium]
MTDNPNAIGGENLRFFGKVTASISHEIKNVLAIMNEKAGLLKDLTLMAQKGITLDINRIQSIADDLRAQIKRGDDIIKNMNKYSHSVDHEIAEVNLSELIGLMVTLSERMASKHGITLIAPPVQSGLSVRTRPFMLEQLIWQCLQMIMERSEQDKTITVEIASSDQGHQIILRNKGGAASLPKEAISWLIKTLHADLKIMNGETGLVVSLPRDISVQED